MLYSCFSLLIVSKYSTAFDAQHELYLKWAASTQILMFLSTARKHCSTINYNTTLLV